MDIKQNEKPTPKGRFTQGSLKLNLVKERKIQRMAYEQSMKQTTTQAVIFTAKAAIMAVRK